MAGSLGGAIDLAPNLFKVDYDPTNVIDDDPGGILGQGTRQLSNVLLKLPELAIEAVVGVLTGIGDVAEWVLRHPGTGLEYLADWLETIPLIGPLVEAITGITGDLSQLDDFFTNWENFLGGLDFTAPDFNPAEAVQDFIEVALWPTGMLAKMVDNLLLQINIPGLDASKITTGTFAQERIQGLVSTLSGLGGDITDLLSDLWNNPQTVISNLISSMIPTLDASKIISGTIDVLRIPGLAASKIVSGALDVLRIPGLPASQIVSGLFDAVRVPLLDASKIISGTFAQSMISGLSTSLGLLLPKTFFNLLTMAGSNLASDPDMSRPEMWTTLTGASISTEQSYTGTTSLKVVCAGADQYTVADVMRTPDGGSIVVATQPGERFVFEAQVRAKSTNVATRNAFLQFAFSDSKGVTPTAYSASTQQLPTSTAWTKLAVTGTVPPGFDQVRFTLCTANTGAVAGDSYYWDAPLVREATETKNLIQQLFGGGSILSNILAAVVPSLDATKITTGQIPQARLSITSIGASIITGVLDALRIPSLDGSKITTGTIAQDRLSITSIAANIITGTLDALRIPGLDASKIVTGALDVLRIPGLAASKIISGFFDALRIPDLDATKITTGTMPQERVSITSIGANIITGVLDVLRIPGLAASKIISGVFGGSLIPDLDATKITTGQLPQTRLSITSIAANIISGVLGTANVPSLDATKITSGSFAQSMVSGLVTMLALGKNSRQGGTNLAAAPDFEDTQAWPAAGVSSSFAGDFSTEQAHTGSRSRKFVAAGASQGFYFVYTGQNTTIGGTSGANIRARAGEKYYAECWYYLPVTNAGAGRVTLNANVYDATYTGTAVTLETHNAPAKGQWNKLSGYYTMPADGGIAPYFQYPNHASNLVDDVVYLDSIMIREVTEPQNIVSSLFGTVGAALSTLLAGVIPGLDATKITTGQIPQERLSITSIAANIITGALDALNIPSLDASKIISGTIDVLRIPGLAASKIISGFFDALRIPDLDATKITTGQLPQARLSITSIAGNIITGAINATVVPLLDAAKIATGTLLGALIPGLDASKITGGVLGTARVPDLDAAKITTGQLPQARLSITSIAANIISGLLGTSNIPNLDATKITSGTFAQSMVSGLGTALASLLPKSIMTLFSNGGSNLVIDGDLTNSTLWPTEGSKALSTDQSYSGTHSLKFTVDSANYSTYHLIRSPDGVAQSLRVSGGDRYYLEAWVRGHASNVNPKAAWIQCGLVDTKGVNPNANQTVPSLVPSTTWQKVSGVMTVPEGYDQMSFYVVTQNNDTTGNVYYWDKVLIREETQSRNIIASLFGAVTSPLTALLSAVIPGLDATKITTGQIPQARLSITSIASNIITGLLSPLQVGIKDYENLLGSGGFEDDNHGWAMGAGREIATDYAHSGTRSLKMTGSGTSWGTGPVIEVSEGEQLYVEMWARRSPDFPGAAAGVDSRLRIGGITAEVSGGVNMANVSLNAGTIPNADEWTKVSYTTVPYPVGSIGIRPQIVRTNCVGTLWIDDIVIRRVKKESWIEGLPGGKIISTLLDAVIPGLDGSKIISGSISQAFLNITSIGANLITGVLDALRIPTLDASKIVSGVVDVLRIPGLAASKIISGVFGAGFIPDLDATKITTGSIPQARLSITSIAANIISGLLGAGNIPDLDATKITTGQLPQARLSITSIAAGIISGILGTGNIPSLDASKVTTGTLGDARIPTLAQSKITGLPAILTTLTGGIQGIKDRLTGYVNATDTDLDNWLLGLLTGDAVPLSSLVDFTPNLQRDPNFASSSILVGNPAWTLDPLVRKGTVGNGLKTTGGATRTITLPKVACRYEQGLDAAINMRWASITGAGATVALGVTRYAGTAVIGTTTLASQAVAGTQATWLELAGEYVASDVEVTHVALTLTVTSATAGSVWFSAVDFSKKLTATAPATFIRGLPDAFDAMGEFVQTLGSIIIKSLTGIPFIGWIFSDLEEEISDWFDDTQATAARADDAWADIGATVSNMVEVVFGQTSTNPSDAGLALDKMYKDLQDNAKAINAMRARDSGDQANGVVINVDFGNYADGPMPSIFTVTYSGPGTSTLVIDGGVAQWNKSNNANRDALVRYNVAPTETDFQILRGTMAAPPEDTTDGGRPHFYACGRMNSTGNSYVWARAWSVGAFFAYRCDIGCTINGVETVWVSNIPLTWALDMTFVCGVGNNPRMYQVWSGQKLVYTHTEVGTASQLGASNRYWGSLAQLRLDNSGVPNGGGKVSGCSVADNELPAVVGTTAMMYRTSTSNVSFTGGNSVTPLPANFFGTVGRSSRDVEANPANGTFTVEKKGTYVISGRVDLNSTQSSLCYLILQVNGVDVGWTEGVYANNGQDLAGSWVEYFEAGDVIRLATMHNGFTVSNLTGEASGTRTKFSMGRLPDDLPVAA